MKKLTLFLSLMILAITMSTNAEAQDKRLEKTQDYVIEVKVEGNTIGKINVSLWPDLAPKTVHNFDSLARAGAYDHTAFHRVIPGFVIQGGDPNSIDKPKSTWGMGNPTQTRVPAEFSNVPHERGILSMARSQDPNSASSQFFICVDDVPSLNGKYAVFGKVTSGMDVVDEIVNMDTDANDNPLKKVEMFVKPVEKK
jgi:peptidyl-prolyl cis-trans isomerase B (cyclophilin B)